MTDILFYHLERQPLEKVIPALLEKTLERGWRAVIRAKTAEKVQLLDEVLWTYAEESFLPHAVASEPHVEVEPIVITAGPIFCSWLKARNFLNRSRIINAWYCCLMAMMMSH